jgi:hypothetical protein
MAKWRGKEPDGITREAEAAFTSAYPGIFAEDAAMALLTR